MVHTGNNYMKIQISEISQNYFRNKYQRQAGKLIIILRQIIWVAWVWFTIHALIMKKQFNVISWRLKEIGVNGYGVITWDT